MHIFNVLLGYFIMLAIMTYNVYILLAVILGEYMQTAIFVLLEVTCPHLD